jgi:predicted DNA-binding protein (UPF0251 family)
MTIDRLEPLRTQYKANLLTSDGYLLAAIEVLDLKDIKLDWLAGELEISRSTLRRSIARLRTQGLTNIPTVDPRSQP